MKPSIREVRIAHLLAQAAAARVILADPNRYGPGMVAAAQAEMLAYRREVQPLTPEQDQMYIDFGEWKEG